LYNYDITMADKKYNMNENMVIKRSGKQEPFSYDKILERLRNSGKMEAKSQHKEYLSVNYNEIVEQVISKLYDKIHTSEIDELMASFCSSKSTSHYDYGYIARNLVISNHQKKTYISFFKAMEQLWENYDLDTGKHSPLIAEDFWNVVQEHRFELDSFIVDNRDYLLDYFGFKTLERNYLMKTFKNEIVERPQHMWMRVAVGIHLNDMDKVRETYDYMSYLKFTHATPTLFNCGTPRPQLSSCFLVAMQGDSINGIYNTLGDVAEISKWSGGIGLHIHNIRATGSRIRGTNGTSNGIVPMLRVFNSTARYVDQGGGKRSGSFAIYIEPWHGDIEEFLELRKNHGDEESRTRDLFTALWIPDYFMEKVEKNENWYLFCPDRSPGLADVVGDDFKELYDSYVAQEKYLKVMPARDLWFKILDSQMETGTPYLLYKDACNKKSNQQNLGVIKSSNLCTEIIEYSSPEETAVCNLASIALSRFVMDNGEFDYDDLHRVTKTVTYNLNKVIDINYYPTDKTRRSNFNHRPIGIGVQGLADVFYQMRIPFDSDKAQEVNKYIFETIYHAALEESCEIAKQRSEDIEFLMTALENCVIHIRGYPDYENSHTYPHSRDWVINEDASVDDDYITQLRICLDRAEPTFAELTQLPRYCCGSYSSFVGSPTSQGKLQFDLWNVEPSKKYEWALLKQSIKTCGIRNSLLVAPMPTASTSQILGNVEAFEPMTNNIFSRRTKAGEFIVVNKYLIKDLVDRGMWTTELKDNIIKNNGSVQQITDLPDELKSLYKTAWEVSMRRVIDMAADRGAFIDQSQSLNLWVEDPNYKNLTSMHFYSWKKGLKTGIYYLRRKPKHQPQQFTIVPDETLPADTTNDENDEKNIEKFVCNPEDGVCMMCSS
jgi:ribonucleoside-diphosphate reductase alpha subunit